LGIKSLLMRAPERKVLGCELRRGENGGGGGCRWKMVVRFDISLRGKWGRQMQMRGWAFGGKALKEPQRLGSSPVEMGPWHFAAESVPVGYTWDKRKGIVFIGEAHDSF
jgi:hypothetical protein